MTQIKSKKFFTYSLLTLAMAAPFAYGADTTGLSLARSNEAAGAQSIATIVYNPAGLVLFNHPEISVSTISASDHLKFEGTASNTDTGGQGTYTQTGTASTRASGYLPALFASYPITNRLYSGVAIYSPFTGEFDFDNNSIVRYQNTEIRLTTIDITPALAFKINSKWSVGLGFDALRAITDDSSQEYGAGDPSTYQTSSDYSSQRYGQAWGYGWHGGVMYQLSSVTRFGFSYDSKITEKLKGTSKLWDPTGALIQESDSYGVHYTLPATYRLGAFHQFNSRWQGMAQIHYVTWGVQNEIAAHGVAEGNNVTETLYDYPHFRNAWGASVGANYIVNTQWLLRGAVGMDQSFVRSSSNQQLSSPNKANETVAAGVHYQATKMVGLDAGYTHIFMPKVDMNNYNPSTGIQLTGKATNNINAAGLQVTWSFA